MYPNHPDGFEWCVNAPAVDKSGAAYTPLAIARDGKIYAQNDGHLFVLGK